MTVRLDYSPIANSYSDLVVDQKYACVDSFVLDSGIQLAEVPIAYKTWGRLSASCDNCLVLCHALTGSSDVEDWWGPLLGQGAAFDTSRFFVFCANVMGSPYGSASPVTINPKTGKIYGPDFPQTTIRDDVRLHKLLLDSLGVISVAAVVGGSMGGMAALEWPLCTPQGYVKTVIPIATSINHSAWGISWAEAQRQCIYADPAFEDGYYHPTPATQPTSGLAAARMVAMLTYRSSTSFDVRFGRKPAKPSRSRSSVPDKITGMDSPPPTPESQPKDFAAHRNFSACVTSRRNTTRHKCNPVFSAQSYLQYQGQKFVARFDSNCYIHLTRKMDSHDVMKGRIKEPLTENQSEREETLSELFRCMPRGALVVGVESDVLFTSEQQKMLAVILPDATLSMLNSCDGHDGFLLEFEILGSLITENLMKQCPWVYECEPLELKEDHFNVIDSVFGEAESCW